MTHEGWNMTVERGSVVARGRTALGAALAMGIAFVSVASCGGDRRYEGKATVVRTYVNRRDAAGEPQVTDVELSLTGCSGNLRMVVRGGGPFAACAAKKSIGSEVPVTLVLGRSREGRKIAKLAKLGECERPDDPSDTRSYETFRSCAPLETDGITVGFRCDVAPTEAAKAACPWL